MKNFLKPTKVTWIVFGVLLVWLLGATSILYALYNGYLIILNIHDPILYEQFKEVGKIIIYNNLFYTFFITPFRFVFDLLFWLVFLPLYSLLKFPILNEVTAPMMNPSLVPNMFTWTFFIVIEVTLLYFIASLISLIWYKTKDSNFIPDS